MHKPLGPLTALMAIGLATAPVDSAQACSDAAFRAEVVRLLEVKPGAGDRVTTDTALLIRVDRGSLGGRWPASALQVTVQVDGVEVPGENEHLTRETMRWLPAAPLPADAEVAVEVRTEDRLLDAFVFETTGGPSPDDPVAQLAQATIDVCAQVIPDQTGDCRDPDAICGCPAGLEVLSYRTREVARVDAGDAVEALFARGLTVKVAYSTTEDALPQIPADDVMLWSHAKALPVQHPAQCAALRVFDAQGDLVGEVVRCAEHRGFCEPGDAVLLREPERGEPGFSERTRWSDCSATTPADQAPVFIVFACIVCLLTVARRG